MKFLLLGVVALAQIHRTYERPTQQRGMRGQQYGGMTQHRPQHHRREQSHFGRFGGRTDVGRRNYRYGTNHHVGRYGGYTRQYIRGQNGNRGHFAGRRDPFRHDTQDQQRGHYNPYRNRGDNGHGEDRLGQMCSRMTAQEAQIECNNYTGRMGCEATCARYRQSRFRQEGLNRNGRQQRLPFELHGRTHYTRGRGRTQYGRQTQQRQFNPYQRHTTQQRRNPFTHGGITGHQRTMGRHQIRIPTEGGNFGRQTHHFQMPTQHHHIQE